MRAEIAIYVTQDNRRFPRPSCTARAACALPPLRLRAIRRVASSTAAASALVRGATRCGRIHSVSLSAVNVALKHARVRYAPHGDINLRLLTANVLAAF